MYFATIAPPRKAFAKGVISAANITHAKVRVRALQASPAMSATSRPQRQKRAVPSA